MIMSKKVLVVDDDRDIATMCKEGFECLGYKVDVFSSSAEALTFFKTCYRDIDLVVTDQTMPEMTGMELATQLKAIRPELPVLLTTGFSEALTPKILESSIIDNVVMKPYSSPQIASAVRTLLDAAQATHSQGPKPKLNEVAPTYSSPPD